MKTIRRLLKLEIKRKPTEEEKIKVINIRFFGGREDEFYDFLKSQSEENLLPISSFVRNFLFENLKKDFLFWKKQRAESGVFSK